MLTFLISPSQIERPHFNPNATGSWVIHEWDQQ
jgi:hypothetical protein